jgi:adenylyltransferase/sulfurtransferase
MNTEMKPENRYARQISLPQVGRQGQEKLSRAKVLCIGAGGLGTPVLLYLAAAGVGTIGIVDADLVEISNLQRQVLFQQNETGRLKVEVARERIQALNPSVKIEIHPTMLDPGNALAILASYHVVVDGTDNFKAKFLINDAAFKLGLPLIHASVLGFEAQLASFPGRGGPCYRCLFPEPPVSAVPNCAEAGVLGAFVGMIGSMQALEVLQCILNDHKIKEPRLTVVDGQTFSVSHFRLNPRLECPVCSLSPEEIQLSSEEFPGTEPPYDLSSDVIWLDVRSLEEWQAGHIPNSIHWPLNWLEEGRSPNLAVSDLIHVYCASGSRSQLATGLLKQLGFTRVKNWPYGLKAGPFRGQAVKEKTF